MRQLCPGISDIDLLCDLKGIVDLDTKIPHGTFNLRMAEQELHRAQVPGSPIDQCRLGSTLMPISALASLCRVSDYAEASLPHTGGMDIYYGAGW